jgi:hypothetical protein
MSPRMRPRRAIAPATLAATALVGCGGPPSGGDYRSGAEDFIEGGLDGQAHIAGVSFAAAECDDPSSTSTGSIFSCSATGSDGTAYTFTVTIVGRNRMDLVSEPPLPTPASQTTPPPAGAPPTTAVAAAAPPPTTAPG